MRREELLTAVEDVRLALLESKLGEAIARMMLPATGPDQLKSRAPEVLEGLKRYTISAQKYNPAARDLTRILDLDQLESTEVWFEVLHIGQAPDRRLRDWYGRIRLVEDVLPGVVGLLQPEALRELMEAIDGTQPVFRGQSLLSVVVLEHEDNLSTPRRLVGVLETVSMLYAACAELEGVSADSLSVAACDSGRDKSFDFVGQERVIEMVRALLVELWERVVFSRQQPTPKLLARLTEDLPTVRRASELEESGKIDPKTAHYLRRQLEESAARFILAGAVLPEIEARSATCSPREILAGNHQRESTDFFDSMLPAAQEGRSAPRELSLDALSADDRGVLARLLDLARSPGLEAGDDGAEDESDGDLRTDPGDDLRSRRSRSEDADLAAGDDLESDAIDVEAIAAHRREDGGD